MNKSVADYGVFGRAAIRAANLLRNRAFSAPPNAWEDAVRLETNSCSSQKEDCPRLAFLGLCENGDVKEVPPGKYIKVKNSKNKQYAVEAVKLLRQKPLLARKTPAQLWTLVGKVQHHGQMDVVLALWKEGFI